MFLLSPKIMRSIHHYRKKKPNNIYDNNASNRKQTQLCHVKKESESESCSVMSNSLQP